MAASRLLRAKSTRSAPNSPSAGDNAVQALNNTASPATSTGGALVNQQRPIIGLDTNNNGKRLLDTPVAVAPIKFPRANDKVTSIVENHFKEYIEGGGRYENLCARNNGGKPAPELETVVQATLAAMMFADNDTNRRCVTRWIMNKMQNMARVLAPAKKDQHKRQRLEERQQKRAAATTGAAPSDDSEEDA